MHELAIAQGIVDLASEHAGGRPVRRVVVEIGDLSGVVADALAFGFESCRRDTLLDAAELVIVPLPGRGRCPACGGEASLATLYDPCPACGAYGLEVIGGDELRVKELEVD